MTPAALAYHQAWRDSHRDAVRAADKRRRTKHLTEHRRKECERVRKGSPGWTKAESRRLKYTYGITLDEYLGREQRQGGVCAACRQPERALDKQGRTKKLAVDHNHETGAIRGLLCDACNRTVGIIETRGIPEDALTRYLKTWDIWEGSNYI